ncbi:hypothetical protein [Paenibacillus sp. LHD-38]|uniref:hypothetical protein n=1 Tax=Paenibacillus sp. LHD-38 TaxID=3072143 RepID=UPI00280EC069|nr:hypothetical protein [Paenibacillus sp. LHD-38]MDQ8735105.1 hypothetical protein [Paenibacillus sp. LHD-38]
MRKRVKKKIHKCCLEDVFYEISISSYWRKKLFESSEKSMLIIDKDNLLGINDYLKKQIKRYDLKYYVSVVPHMDAAGWDDWGNNLFYFKFEPVEFSHIVSYSANNPNVI